MAISESRHGDAVVIRIDGRLDNSSTEELEQLVRDVLERKEQKILFDFSGLDYINSSGLRILIMAFQQLRPDGGKIGICGIRDYIQEVFEVSGYDRLFAMFPTVEESDGF